MDEVGGLESYGGRLIPIIDLIYRSSNNLLVLGSPPDKCLMRYFKETLSLSLPKLEILSHRQYTSLSSQLRRGGDSRKAMPIGSIRDHSAGWIDGFVTDTILAELAEVLAKSTINTVNASKSGNNKLFLHSHLAESGYPVFDTFIAQSPAEVIRRLPELRKKGYATAVVKAQIGASGIGMIKLDTSECNGQAVPDHMFFEGAALVQGWLDEGIPGVDRIGSPSVQLFLSDHTVHLYDLTEQILSSESVHQGNMAPPQYLNRSREILSELIRQGIEAGNWLHRQGYRGTASIDFQVIMRSKQLEVRVCEINARITGATYPSILARYLMPHGAWLMRNLKFAKSISASNLMESLKQAGILYTQDKSNGVLPINFNVNVNNEINKGQFLFLGEKLSVCARLLRDIEEVPPVVWEYDRD